MNFHKSENFEFSHIGKDEFSSEAGRKVSRHNSTAELVETPHLLHLEEPLFVNYSILAGLFRRRGARQEIPEAVQFREQPWGVRTGLLEAKNKTQRGQNRKK